MKNNPIQVYFLVRRYKNSNPEVLSWGFDKKDMIAQASSEFLTQLEWSVGEIPDLELDAVFDESDLSLLCVSKPVNLPFQKWINAFLKRHRRDQGARDDEDYKLYLKLKERFENEE